MSERLQSDPATIRAALTHRTGIVLEMPETDYHAHPALSSTNARRILDSPARYQYGLTHPQEHKPAFDLGSAVHSKVLGTGYGIEVLDFDNYRTKVAQEARDTAYAAGLIPMLRSETTVIDDMAEAVLAHQIARALLEQKGDAEASVFAHDPETGVDLRCRFDYLAPITVDLKTSAKSASATSFAKTAAAFGYDVQEGHYGDTLHLATGERRQMVFVVVETEAPHLVAVHQLDRDFAEMGVKKARRAREVFAECTASGIWPGHPSEITLASPPMWAVYDFQDNYS